MPGWLKSILDCFSRIFGKTAPDDQGAPAPAAPAPAPGALAAEPAAPAPEPAAPALEAALAAAPEPAVPPLSALMQRVAAIQGVETVEAYDAKRRFRNCFHEAGHAFVAHAYGETVEGIYIDTPHNRPYAAITKNLSDQLDDQINRGLAGTPKFLETLLQVLAIAVAGELQDIEADHERTRTSSRLDAHAWNQNPEKPTEDRDRIIVRMKRAGFKGRNDIVQQAEDRAKDRINERRAQYEALVTKLYDDSNVKQPELNYFLNA